MKKIASGLLSMAFLATMFLAGCGGDASSSAPSVADSTPPPVASSTDDGGGEGFDISKKADLVMYVLGSEPNLFGDMLTEFNTMLEADLNATLTVNWIGWSDFANQYPLILSSGEPIDLIYAATWLNYYQQAQKGAYMPLEDLLPEYAPQTWGQMTDAAKYQATVKEHIYCVPTGKSTYSAYGAIVRGDLMEQYDIPEFHDFEGFENYLTTIADNEPTMVPTAQYSAEILFDDVYMMSKGLYPLTGSTGSAYWLDPAAADPAVFSPADWEGFPEYLEMMNRWYEKGFWSASALSNQDDKMFETGKAAARIHNLDTWVSEYKKNPDWDVRWYELTGDINVLSSVQDAMAIPISAKNPERALMLLEKWRTDQAWFDLFTYGIPGVHSEIYDDGTVMGLDEDNFQLDSCSWGFRTDTLTRDSAGLPEAYDDYMAYIRSHLVENKFRSFAMDTEPVKNEYAAVQNVMQQYYDPMLLGYIDPVSGLEDLKGQLASAGSDSVIEELQKQIDAFIVDFG